MSKNLIIAIDGTAGSGKSTTAKRVADRLRYLHIDTGAMYRAAAYAVIKYNINPDDKKEVEELIGKLKIRLERRNGVEVLLNDEPVTGVIRTKEVTEIVSKISSYGMVREKMVEEQRAIAEKGGVVLEGRDIGTVVFPDADVKFFFIAELEERARRRQRELAESGEHMDIGAVLSDIALRDKQDSTREVSPLRRADDAITIDTSGITLDQQVDMVLEIVAKVKNDRSKAGE